MIRRDFLKTGTLSALGISLLSATETFGQLFAPDERAVGSAKNIIFLVSDGMSNGTLTMANLLSQRMYGRESKWISLYRENKVVRAFMDTASADSMVTDSAASSSAWGGGVRVNNGSLNVNADGSFNTPILQKFKSAGKKVGCVTTVPITHATPAGFCICNKSRSDQNGIALQYLPLRFDVMMGGGDKYFNASKRKDKVDVYSQFEKADYQLAKTKQQMQALDHQKPVLAVFDNDALPFSVDYAHDQKLQNTIPTLSEMTVKAIDLMKDHAEGFVLQVEGGKVDWAAHANDIAGLLYDQVAFDEAVKVAIDFAEKDKETLVIITTDHGNANPGLIYGKNVNDHFDSVQLHKHTNEWILNGFTPESTLAQIKERIAFANGFDLTDDEAKTILSYYSNLEKKDDGLYNYKNLPYKTFAEMQKSRTSVGWISMDHSADYTELAMFGPGSDKLKPFIKNTDLHYFMLEAAEVENKF